MLMKRLDNDLITRFELHHCTRNNTISTYEELHSLSEKQWGALQSTSHTSFKSKTKKGECSKLHLQAVRSTSTLLVNFTNRLKCATCSFSL